MNSIKEAINKNRPNLPAYCLRSYLLCINIRTYISEKVCIYIPTTKM